mgnify:CR=1 FL=1|nr:DUF4376 domain-containing protein [uncultured Dongia sp.]
MARHYIRNDNTFAGTGVDGGLPPGAVAEVPAAPSDGRQVWDATKEVWVLPLDLIKVQRVDEVGALYDAALIAGMAYQGTVLQIRPQDQANLTTMGNEARWAKALGAAWPTQFAWRMADDTFLALPTADDMIALGEAAKAEVYRLRLVSWGHKDAITALETAEAVLAYDISSGWQNGI